MRVVPGGVAVGDPVDGDRVVGGEPLPRAKAAGAAVLEVLRVERLGRKVAVPSTTTVSALRARTTPCQTATYSMGLLGCERVRTP